MKLHVTFFLGHLQFFFFDSSTTLSALDFLLSRSRLMTRYTKLGRKKHEESGSWEAAPLTPAKTKQNKSEDKKDKVTHSAGKEQKGGAKKRSFSNYDGKWLII